jgi:hypothetical protein
MNKKSLSPNNFSQPISIPKNGNFKFKSIDDAEKEREFVGMCLGLLKLKNVSRTLQRIEFGNI